MRKWSTFAAAVIVSACVGGAAHGGTQTYQVFTARDDTYSSGSQNYLGTTLYTPYSSNDRLSFMRWQVNIPKGTTITSAYLRLVPEGESGGTSVARIQLIDRDDCEPFFEEPFAWAVTPTYADWTISAWPPGTWVQSDDIKSLVQEFIDRPGYEYGNGLGLRIGHSSGTWKRSYAWDYDQHQYAPLLEVNFTGGEAYLELWMAEPHVRIAQKIYCRIDNVAPTDKLIAKLDGVPIFQKNSDLQTEEVFVADYRSLLAGSHTLLVEIRDSGDVLRGSASRTWTTLHDGEPTVGIDENNAFRVNGELFFPVTPWGVEGSGVATWLPYMNTLNHQGWNTARDITGWTGALNNAQSYGLRIIGPLRGNYWPNGDDSNIVEDPPGSGNWIHYTALDIDRLADYVNATRDHPALFMWGWKDEPDLGGTTEYIPATEVKRWTDKCHELDTNHPHLMNIVGYSFTHGDEPNWNNERAQSYCFLYNDRKNVTMGDNEPFDKKTPVCDVIAFDYYPYEYATKYDWCSLEDSLLAVDRLRDWNYNLLPTMTWIETCDIHADPSHPWTPPPTPAELHNLVWTNVIHGVKGIQWFHYFEPTPPENYAVMASFLTQITELTPAVLGPEEVSTAVTETELGGGRVDIMTRMHDQHLYIFAAEIRAESQAVRFDVDQLALGTLIDVYGEARTIISADGYFEDSFDPLGVHIYVIEATGPGSVLSWQAVSDHGAGQYDLQVAEGYIHSPAAGLTRLKINFSKAVDPATVSAADFTLVGVSGGDISGQIDTTTVSPDFRTVTVTFSAALPNADRYTMTVLDTVKDTTGVSFGGQTTRQFNCLAGDVDASGQVTAADMIAVRNSAGIAVNELRARYDIDGSGMIGLDDMRAIRPYLGAVLP